MNVNDWVNKYSVDCKLKYPSKATQENYISSVTAFLFCFKDEKEPKYVTTEKIKLWLLSCKNENTRNHRLCAIKSFYQITVGMPVKLDKIPYSRKAQSLPMPLCLEEVEALFKSCENKKHLAIMALLFGCGMRVGEVINLKAQQIDRNRGVIHIINGKGLKDRVVPMDNFILTILEEYYREYRPDVWMFNGQYSTKENPTQYTDKSINQFIKDIGKKAGITKRLYSHLGRHSYATMLVENGIDLGIIQNILGHKKQATTLMYAKISSARISKIHSPLSNINLNKNSNETKIIPLHTINNYHSQNQIGKV